MSEQINNKPVKVLIVEDDLEYAEMMQEFFSKTESGRFDTVHVDDLNKALKRLTYEKPDVILLDLSLPDSNADETFFTVSARAPEIPVVVVTGHTDRSLAVKAVREGAQDYIIKGDFDLNQLALALLYAIERHQARSILEQLSFQDELTGLLNRRGFMSLAPQNIKIAHRANWEVLLIFIDLDRLKWINDTFGHQEGDKVLREAAEILKETFRSSDLIARFGGDEFAILAINTSQVSIETITSRLKENLRNHNEKKRGYQISLSYGIERYDPHQGSSLDELIARADQALYEKKRSKQE